ncbi:hypothetical protein [Clostridium chauvoei]|uniref:Glycosyl transferase family 28 C-terminal domain-containing protein n=3 Tax=Clostridium chauvoei TaxID=46867 RepID=A0A1U6IZ07_9CLOT|nr:hypothetical protein [Clostridium chauvoei]ATD54254.1 hypothetical protein BTM20_02990 [Clostridium chauvoei]ATD58065.1 hypothetical protein BTM21_10090 [Clostridium chauvoei]MBX7279862.1 hypothetical protein [Clostridium chauvoei]MBX7282220.1 hypothetical protein [Clostridium chauvoei]MBX7284752.1 hypothetical protein [Clostridium chauvoei]
MTKNKKIAFYISDHGFGHASRNIPIIRYILGANKEINIIIKTGVFQGEFLKNSLEEFSNRIEYYFSPMDVGLILKEGSLEIDSYKLKEKVQLYIDSFEENIRKESEFLHYKNVDLVVSDIVPWIFKACKKVNIKSMLISNFTWVDIYKEYLEKDIIDKYEECYYLADKTLLYKLYIDNMKSYIKEYEEVGVVCRDFNKEKINKIKSKYDKPLVFISVGRSVSLNDNIDVSSLDYYFIATEGINLIGDNVKYLPKETKNTHEYLMACNYIITKAGFGTIAEALIGRSKIAVLSRDTVAEDRNTIKKLKERNLALEVSYENFDIEKILKRLEKFKPNYKENDFTNDYENIGNKIINYLKDGV